MDNKKIIIFIIGLLLMLVGLIGFNYSKSHLNTIYEDANIETENTENGAGVNEVNEVNEANETEISTEQKEETAKAETKIGRKVLKNNFVTSPKTSNNIKQSEEEPTVLSETVIKDNEIEDPYVDSDGSVVVRNEFKPNIREKIPYRGVVYTIKTKFAETSKN